uniref:Uncharacterized protein n=1 Tax=Arundo donax TaxID=35708 RepID=A0A0A9CBP7_ARUDO
MTCDFRTHPSFKKCFQRGMDKPVFCSPLLLSSCSGGS